jgi:hypothetical protein
MTSPSVFETASTTCGDGSDILRISSSSDLISGTLNVASDMSVSGGGFAVASAPPLIPAGEEGSDAGRGTTERRAWQLRELAPACEFYHIPAARRQPAGRRSNQPPFGQSLMPARWLGALSNESGTVGLIPGT